MNSGQKIVLTDISASAQKQHVFIQLTKPVIGAKVKKYDKFLIGSRQGCDIGGKVGLITQGISGEGASSRPKIIFFSICIFAFFLSKLQV